MRNLTKALDQFFIQERNLVCLSDLCVYPLHDLNQVDFFVSNHVPRRYTTRQPILKITNLPRHARSEIITFKFISVPW